MPLLKSTTRSVKVEPSDSDVKAENVFVTKEKIEETAESVCLKEIMPPYLSTLKFHLKDLNDVEAISHSDLYLEEGVEYSSLPTHKTQGAQTITLPMNMPIVESENCFRRKGDSSLNLKDRLDSSTLSIESTVLQLHRRSHNEEAVDAKAENQGYLQPAVGKWFNDIDKLTSFKAKHMLPIFSKEKREAIKEWTSSPKNFYKCILKCRQKQLVTKGLCKSTKSERSKDSTKRVSFPADILLFSAIEENSAIDLINIIRRNKINVNLSKNARGLPPLHRAVQRGAVDCVRVLLNHAADVNLQDSSNTTALKLAISARQFECIVLLIECGASIEEYTKQRIQEYENVLILSKSCYRSFEANV
ncbi:PREDICTED: uncharacterized protein LOC107342046 [Acropora digitifera]|uniref:uncharacterized protein LOC107342046 n=1 Tax=Acropora digitifera TaxID=70779 RepID=UPI00077A6DC1|nr:PREDICTED: uncharacterized protein LOC107342046 [Acropora digitifera]